MVFNISMGLRRDDHDLLLEIDDGIQRNIDEITMILDEADVPRM